MTGSFTAIPAAVDVANPGGFSLCGSEPFPVGAAGDDSVVSHFEIGIPSQ